MSLTPEEKRENKRKARLERRELKRKVHASRKRILKVYPRSFGRFLSVIFVLLGFVLALVVNVWFPAFLPQIGGRASIFTVPIIYGVYGFIIGVLCALIFNVFAKRFKGLIQVETNQ